MDNRHTRKGADLMTMIILTLVAVVIGVLVITQWDQISSRINVFTTGVSVDQCHKQLCQKPSQDPFTGCYNIEEASSALQGGDRCSAVFSETDDSKVRGNLKNVEKGNDKRWIVCEEGEPRVDSENVYADEQTCKNNLP